MRRKNNHKIVYILIGILFLANLSILKPAKAASASLYLSPSNGTYVIGNNFSVSVRVDTDGQVINAGEGIISFDNNLLEVAGISVNTSIFSMWIVKPSFVNSKGTVSFSGGVPRPGFKGDAGLLFNINFKSIKAGSAFVRFSSGAVLANDEKGTNILASMGSANYVISPKVEAPKATGQETEQNATDASGTLGEVQPTGEGYNEPIITSATHPDQNTWYKENNVKFDWKLPDGITAVSYDFNKLPNADAKNESKDLITGKEYNNVESGVWYFHIKFKDINKWGTLNHYRIMIDSNPPEPFDIRIIQTETGKWPILNFGAKDKESGVKKYEIIVGSLENKSYELDGTESSFKLSDLEAGDHTAIIKAIDSAGNVTYSEIKFKIEPIEMPKIVNFPVEIRSSDKFYISGTALPNIDVNVFVQNKNNIVVNEKVKSDSNGNWFFINNNGLSNDRYLAFVQAINENGVKSLVSPKVTFLVSPPVFTRIGSWVINYFTVFVSLLFMIILIIVLIIFLVSITRKKLKKETVEVGQTANKYLDDLKNTIDEEFTRLDRVAAGSREYKKEKMETKRRLKIKIEGAEKGIAKEVKDVKDMLD